MGLCGRGVGRDVGSDVGRGVGRGVGSCVGNCSVLGVGRCVDVSWIPRTGVLATACVRTGIVL